MENQYNHSEFIKCKDIATFAKIYSFRDKHGKILGRNKIFKILRVLNILDKNNVPYQSYLKHFKIFQKEYHSAVQTYRKTIVFIKPDSLKYLAGKVQDYLDSQINDDSSKNYEPKPCTLSDSCIEHQSSGLGFNHSYSIGSPLDFDKQSAFNWLNSLPDFMKDTYFAVEVRKKWGFDS